MMKTGKFILSVALIMALPAFLLAQGDSPVDSTGLPGDNFSLEGALEMFKKAESPEAFEKLLNTEDNYVNNLDLNEDGQIDYIRVVDNMDGDAHAIVLQVPVSADESQDIAVIEIEKNGEESAMLQIIGDEDIFGSQVIVEPAEEETQMNKGRNGPAPVMAPIGVVVNVWVWPSVRYVYRPGYTVYVSPWRWAAYPAWWRPWRPHPWGWFHVRVRPYYPHYHVVTVHRVGRAHAVYTPHRVHSKTVHTRTTVKVNGPNGGSVTRTRTTTQHQGPRGGQTTHQKTTTTKKGPNGNVQGKKTTTKTTRHH